MKKEAAFENDFHFESSKNWAIIHDLRIQLADRVAQIDHLLINRFLDVWVLETKRFGQGIAINEQGEFSAFSGKQAYGIPSPIEQNQRHIVILKQLFDNGVVELPRRLGFVIKPNIKSGILVSKNARITRPRTPMAGIDTILKIDQLKARIDRETHNDNNLLSIAKIIPVDTLQDFATRLAAVHQPIDVDWHGKFGLAKKIPVNPHSEPVAVNQCDHQAGKLNRVETCANPTITDEVVTHSDVPTMNKSKLLCTACGCGVPYNVAKFCWVQKKRFGGNVYCFECQKTVGI